MEENEQKVETSCRDCIFADFQGSEQVGCKAIDSNGRSRVDKYCRLGRVRGVDTGVQKHYIIDGICVFCTNQEWANKHNIQLNDTNTAYQKLVKKYELAYECIVVAEQNDTLEAITRTITSLSNQLLKPKKISLVLKVGNPTKMGKLVPLMHGTGCKWEVRHMLDTDIDENKAIDQILKFDNVPYLAVFHAGHDVPNHIFHNLNLQILNNMLNFAAIVSDCDYEHGVMIVSRAVYNNLQGSLDEPLIDKIKAKEGKIYSYNELFKI